MSDKQVWQVVRAVREALESSVIEMRPFPDTLRHGMMLRYWIAPGA